MAKRRKAKPAKKVVKEPIKKPELPVSATIADCPCGAKGAMVYTNGEKKWCANCK